MNKPDVKDHGVLLLKSADRKEFFPLRDIFGIALGLRLRLAKQWRASVASIRS